MVTATDKEMNPLVEGALWALGAAAPIVIMIGL